MENLVFEVSWDEEAEVWYTSETPIQGAMAEAPTLEELSKKLSVIIPEVLAVDRETKRKATVDGKIKSRHFANRILKNAGIDETV